MLVEFNQSVAIEVFDSYDEALDDGETHHENFNSGDTVEFDVIDHPLRFREGEFEPDPTMVNVQFNDGSVALGLSTDWYKIIRGE